MKLWLYYGRTYSLATRGWVGGVAFVVEDKVMWINSESSSLMSIKEFSDEAEDILNRATESRLEYEEPLFRLGGT